MGCCLRIQCSLTEHDEPLGTLDAVLIGLGVTETLPLGSTGLIDLGLGAVTDEDGLTTPLDDDLLERVLGILGAGNSRMKWRIETRTFLPSGMAPRAISTLA